MGARGGSGPSARSGVARLRESGDFDNLSTLTGTQINCLFPVFRDQDGVSRTYLHRRGSRTGNESATK